MIVKIEPSVESLARAALQHLESDRVPDAIEALEEAWRAGYDHEWILEVREEALVRNGAKKTSRAIELLRQHLPNDLPTVAAIVCTGERRHMEATRDAIRSNTIQAEFLEAGLLPSQIPNWNEAIERSHSEIVILLEAGDRPSPGLVDRLAQRVHHSSGHRLVVSIPGWHEGKKLPEPGLAPLQILWTGGPPRWSAFPRDLWLQSGGLDPSLGRLAWRHLWMRFLSLGATGDRLAFDRIDLATPPLKIGDEPWELFLERIALRPDLRERVGRLFLLDIRQILDTNSGGARAAPLVRAASALFPEREDLRKMLATLATPPEHSQPQEAMSRAGTLVQAGQADQARAMLELAAKRWPDCPEVAHSLAWVLLQTGRASEAEQVLRETARRFPDDPISRECLVEITRASGSSDGSRAQDPELGQTGKPPRLVAGHRKDST